MPGEHDVPIEFFDRHFKKGEKEVEPKRKEPSSPPSEELPAEDSHGQERATEEPSASFSSREEGEGKEEEPEEGKEGRNGRFGRAWTALFLLFFFIFLVVAFYLSRHGEWLSDGDGCASKSIYPILERSIYRVLPGGEKGADVKSMTIEGIYSLGRKGDVLRCAVDRVDVLYGDGTRHRYGIDYRIIFYEDTDEVRINVDRIW